MIQFYNIFVKGMRKMTTEHICIMIAIIVYLGAMLYVGYRVQRITMTPPTSILAEESSGHW